MLPRFELPFAGANRYYLAHVPPGEAPEEGWPLVLCFHGGGSTPTDMARFCHLTQAANRHQFALVFPAGSGPSPEYLTWNAGVCCGHAARRKVDDIGFIEALLEQLPTHLPFDPARLYATGMSNGGMFCYRLAGAMPHRLAAIASVAGCLACEPTPLAQPVPVLHLHGTADEFVPFGGGAGTRSLRRIDFTSVEQTLLQWATLCGFTVRRQPPRPLALTTSGTHPADALPLLNDQSLTATRTVYAQWNAIDRNLRDAPLHDAPLHDAIVEICIHGGGHTWPGQAPPIAFMGRTLLSLPANDLIWEFFEGFRLER